MDKPKLYITVGVPGGEFACWADDHKAASKLFEADWFLSMLTRAYRNDSESGVSPVFTRPAPQDVVDWVTDDRPDSWHYKRVGGWQIIIEALEQSGDDPTFGAYIPVPLTANLTVINPEECDEPEST